MLNCFMTHLCSLKETTFKKKKTLNSTWEPNFYYYGYFMINLDNEKKKLKK
jgi:hypothetical protein